MTWLEDARPRPPSRWRRCSRPPSATTRHRRRGRRRWSCGRMEIDRHPHYRKVRARAMPAKAQAARNPCPAPPRPAASGSVSSSSSRAPGSQAPPPTAASRLAGTGGEIQEIGGTEKKMARIRLRPLSQKPGRDRRVKRPHREHREDDDEDRAAVAFNRRRRLGGGRRRRCPQPRKPPSGHRAAWVSARNIAVEIVGVGAHFCPLVPSGAVVAKTMVLPAMRPSATMRPRSMMTGKRVQIAATSSRMWAETMIVLRRHPRISSAPRASVGAETVGRLVHDEDRRIVQDRLASRRGALALESVRWVAPARGRAGCGRRRARSRPGCQPEKPRSRRRNG